MEIEKIAEEIREILNKKREELQLTFEEEEHKYTMVDLDGNLRTDFPSVSKVMKLFYDEFPSEEKAYEMSGGDPDKTERLLNEWAEKGRKSTNMGSRVHYFLEEHVLKEFNISKEVRQPIFDCDAQQIIVSDTMIIAGKEYIKLLQDRGCVLLDTGHFIRSEERRVGKECSPSALFGKYTNGYFIGFVYLWVKKFFSWFVFQSVISIPISPLVLTTNHTLSGCPV